jgi:hypothetical protein
MLAFALTGCGGSPDPALSASTTQFRFDEGTDVLRTGVVNEGTDPVRIERAALRWPGFDGPVAVVDRTLGAGEVAAFDLRYGAAHCDTRPTPTARLDVLADDRLLRIPVEVEYADLLVDLWKRACATARLEQAATVTLEEGSLIDGVYWTDVLLARTRDRAPVSLVDVRGSVNLQLDAHLPARLRDPATKVPVRIRPVPGCSPHTRSQSQQEFLFSAWVSVGDAPPVRVFLRVTPKIRASLSEMIDEHCRRSG